MTLSAPLSGVSHTEPVGQINGVPSGVCCTYNVLYLGHALPNHLVRVRRIVEGRPKDVLQLKHIAADLETLLRNSGGLW